MLVLYIMSVVIAHVFGVPQLTIQPSTVLSGDSVKFTCRALLPSGQTGFAFVRLYKDITADENVVATLTFLATPPSIFMNDKDVKARVPKDHRSIIGTSFSLNYTRAKCEDGSSYICKSVTRGNIGEESTRSPLTVIDNADAVVLSRPERCGADADACQKCTSDQSLIVRNVSEAISLTCLKNMSFVDDVTNSFEWHKRSDENEWGRLTDDIIGEDQESTTHPPPEKGQCNPKEVRESSLRYIVTKGDGPRLEIRCVAVLSLSDGREYRTVGTIGVCVVGDKAKTKTTAKTPTKPTTTPGGTDDSGFSLLAGPGIALLTACVVVVVAAMAGAAYWYYRRQHRAPAQENADYYYADGGENYT